MYRSALALLLLSACDYEVYVDPDAKAPLNVITGTIVVAGLTEPSDTIVLVFPGNNGPPPGVAGGLTNTGQPITFAVVPGSEFTTGNTDGTMSAPFYLTGLADNSYIVTALIDLDANFHPLVDFMGGSTCGDMTGAHVSDLLAGTLAPIDVSGGTHTSDIAIFVGVQNTWGRPAWEFDSETPPKITRQIAIDDPEATQSYKIHTAGISAFQPFEGLPPYEIAGPLDVDAWDGEQTCESTFVMNPRDLDGDNLPDPHPDIPPTPNVHDIWPRVFVSYLGEPQADGTFVNTRPEGETWAGAGVINPTNVFFGFWPLNQFTPSDEMEVIWVPGAKRFYTALEGGTCDSETHIYDPVMNQCVETVTNPLDIPAGAWGVTVMQYSGQTWTIPNTTAGETLGGLTAQANYLLVE
jgi:hypothetical protein